jgi:D-threonate/D-erythronate kinase
MAMRLQPLRLLADDLTGALDSAAAFASPAEPVAVCWRGEVPLSGAIALDSRSREASAEEARAAVAKVARPLWAAGGCLAFKKVDSLLRGQEVAELSSILGLLKPTSCLIAPAFPAQRRLTRAGRQGVLSGKGWQPVAVDLAAEFARAGHDVTLVRAGAPVPPRISLWDVESDVDLDAIVAAAAGLEGMLWVGSGGLAAALARAMGVSRAVEANALARPVLGLIGSEHAVIREQLARLGAQHSVVAMSGAEDAAIAERLANEGVAFASVDIPTGTSRRDAATMIEARFAGLLAMLNRPGTLVAAGGETLRGICDALEADRLDVIGEISPGVPRSILRGGRWDGLAVVSKSGGFGGPDLLKQLVAGTPATPAGAAA